MYLLLPLFLFAVSGLLCPQRFHPFLWSTFWLCSSGVLSNWVFSSLCHFLSLLASVYCLLWYGFACSIILWLTRICLCSASLYLPREPCSPPSFVHCQQISFTFLPPFPSPLCPAPPCLQLPHLLVLGLSSSSSLSPGDWPCLSVSIYPLNCLFLSIWFLLALCCSCSPLLNPPVPLSLSSGSHMPSRHLQHPFLSLSYLPDSFSFCVFTMFCPSDSFIGSPCLCANLFSSLLPSTYTREEDIFLLLLSPLLLLLLMLTTLPAPIFFSPCVCPIPQILVLYASLRLLATCLCLFLPSGSFLSFPIIFSASVAF